MMHSKFLIRISDFTVNNANGIRSQFFSAISVFQMLHNAC
jgi:hypothetical protein